MLRNYFKIAWRNMMKDRQFTLLNMLGLTAGLACTLLIWLWVNDEISVDKFFANDDRIYQLMEHRKVPGQSPVSDESSGMLGEVLKARMPEIEYAAALAPHEWFQKFTLSANEKDIKAYGQYAGKDYFNIFSFKLLAGDKDSILGDKRSIAISDELANRLFGTTQGLLGKAIRFQHERDFFVSGVFEEPNLHSSQQFDFVLSFEYMKDAYPWVKSWNNTGPHNFVLLKKGTNISDFNKRIAGIVTENTSDTTRTAFAMPFADSYLANTFSHGSRVGGKMEYVRLFSLIALFILSIACINFMNLSTAKASKRMKEVGIKKVVGASRAQLIIQFITESIILCFMALLIAILVAWVFLPAFNQITGKEIQLNFDLHNVFVLFGIALITGLLSGSYPAFYLSGFKPVSILKGKFQSSLAEVFSRKGLVIFQFALSAILIISVIVVNEQIQFIQKTKPGYDKDNILRFYAEGKITTSEGTFVEDLKRIPNVVNASYTWHAMVGRNYGDYALSWPGKNPNESDYVEGFGVGYDFIETMGMQMAEGRAFSRAFADTAHPTIILNQAAIQMMNLKIPVGQTITYADQPRQIIGIVKDFHFESLHEPVKPAFMILETGGSPWDKMMVRIKAENQGETIAAIQRLYQSYNPGFPFDYNFLDESYQKQYLTETRISILSKIFAVLAILISCLGLFGLAAFTAQRRQKEMAVRKVVGASVSDVVFMLSKDFLRLILISMLISFPLSWWAMNEWLQGFAYRIHLSALIFGVAALSVILITLLTISYQSVRAALANPVKSLGAE
ncbi:MAG TPA: ABC transporter permease [Puia sp.]|nr:ABC transporter permease [Puia sp.]